MARRFGRNQKRRMREETERLTAIAKTAQHRLAQLEQETEERILHATRNGEWIKVNIDSLLDPRERSLTIKAEFEARARPSFQAALKIDPRMALTQDRWARENFALAIGRDIAQYALNQMTKW